MPAWAALTVSLGDVAGEGWQAEGVELRLSSEQPGDYQLQLHAARVVLPVGQWQGINLDCPKLQFSAGGYQCPALRLVAKDAQGPQQLAGDFSFVDAQHWSLSLTGVKWAGGRWKLTADAQDQWQLYLTGQGVSAAQLLALLPPASLPPWQWQGRLDVQARLQGRADLPARANVQLNLRDVSWSSPDGLQAAQALSGKLELTARADSKGWTGQLETRFAKGQLYADPVYLEFNKHPLSATTRGAWAPSSGAVALDKMTLQFGELLRLTGQLSGTVSAPEKLDASIDIKLPDLAVSYPVLLQPWAYGGALGALQIAGRAEAGLTLAQGAPSAAGLQLHNVHLDDERGRFGISGLAGALQWRAASQPPDSRLSWQSGHVYAVDFGAAATRLRLQDKQVSLREPLVLPLLDGTLRIPRLNASDVGGDAPAWQTSLQAQALSLPRLTQALGWPALSGQLSVKIPEVHYAQGVLALEGELVAQAFDGEVRVSGLQLREPLSPAPVFEAEATLQGLDLERITRVFDFGRITGRLDGQVKNLQLVGWEPVAFNALLQSPANDDQPHRISQRAVENLTALGNSGVVALSGTFLRFFESFRYDRLMFRVDLNGQRATLDGIAHPDGGYYLVKGAGLPRIDVIGRNRDVAWRDLVERLRRISLKGAEVR